jgi:hypothetical protein
MNLHLHHSPVHIFTLRTAKSWVIDELTNKD